MKRENDEREPIEVLYEIEQKLNQVYDEMYSDEEQTSEDKSNQMPWWRVYELNRSQAIALEAVYLTSGTPTAREANEEYIKGQGDSIDKETNTDGTPKISARLTELVETPYLKRTPNIPYRYWVTDEGREIMGETSD